MNLLLFLFLSFLRDLLPGFPVARYIPESSTEVKIPGAHSMTQTQYEYKNDSAAVNPGEPVKEYLFRKNGLIERIYLRDHRTGKRTLAYEFDVAGRIRYHQREGQHYNYLYDEGKRTSKELYYDKDSAMVETTIAFYNKTNQLTKKEIYRNDGKLSRYWTYTYNTHGDMTSELFVNTPDGISTPGRIITPGGKQEQVLLPGDTTCYQYSYGDTTITKTLRDGKVREIEKRFSVKDTTVTQRFLWVQKQNTLVKASEYKEAKGVRIELRKVSTWHRYVIKDGLLMKYTNYNDTKVIRMDNYHYIRSTDTHQNWTSLITQQNGVNIKRTDRLIDYY